MSGRSKRKKRGESAKKEKEKREREKRKEKRGKEGTKKGPRVAPLRPAEGKGHHAHLVVVMGPPENSTNSTSYHQENWGPFEAPCFIQ